MIRQYLSTNHKGVVILNKSFIAFATLSSLVSPLSFAAGTAFSITQSSDTSTVTELSSVACSPSDDSYFRRFNLDEVHGLAAKLEISGIDFAVEQSDSLTLTVNLYAINISDELLLGNLTTIGTAQLQVSSLDDLSTVNTPISGIIDGGINDLVVEIYAPDNTTGTTFFIGSNANGQIAPSYLASTACDAEEPTDIADLNYPDMHLILTVDGDQIGSTELIFTDGFEVTTVGL